MIESKLPKSVMIEILKIKQSTTEWKLSDLQSALGNIVILREAVASLDNNSARISSFGHHWRVQPPLQRNSFQPRAALMNHPYTAPQPTAAFLSQGMANMSK